MADSVEMTFPADAVSTRERILLAALDAFAETGYDGTTTRDICNRAGVNVAAVNYHWGSKEELWVAVCDRVTRDVIRVTQGWLDTGAPVEEMAPRFLSALWDYLAADPRPVRIGQWAALQAESMDFPTVYHAFEPFLRLGVDYFTELQQAGKIRPELDVEVVLCTFYGHFVQAFLDQAGMRMYFGADLGNPEHAARVKRSVIRSALLLLGFDPAAYDESTESTVSAETRAAADAAARS